MRIRIILCLCFSLSGGPLFSQALTWTGRSPVDSLNDLLRHAANDSQRVDYLFQLGNYLQVVEKDYPAAISNIRRALVLCEADNLYPQTIGNYAVILNLYFYTGDYPDAMKIATKRLALAESHHDTLRVAKSYNTIGFIYRKQGNTGEAGRCYSLYLDLSEKTGDSASMADAYNSIGEIKAADHRFQEALSFFFRAYTLYDRLGMPERIAYTSYNISRAYKETHDYDHALVYSTKTMQEIRTTGCNQYDKADYFINAGDIYKNLYRFGDAIEMTWRGLAIAQNIRHREDIQDAWYTLSGIYARQHRYDSAYFYFILYSRIKDSINNEQSRKEIEEIHEQYDVDKKDKEIQLQKGQLIWQGLLRNIVIFSSLFLIALMLLLYNRRRLRQRAVYEKKLNQQRNDLFGAIIMAQDNERKRIAQDIHDTLGSILSAAKLNLSALDEERTPYTPGQNERYKTSLKLLDEASGELRNIAHNIMPAGLSRIGLPAVVKSLLDSISASSGIKINYNVYGFDERLPESVEISIYLILSELINNVIRHSSASLLTIQMIRYPRYINIVVEDNGVGIDKEVSPGPGKGMGLSNISYRVGYLKGTIDIDSKRGAGTTVMIEIPC